MLEKKKKFRKDFKGQIREIHKESLTDTYKRFVEKEKIFSTKENTVDTNLTKRWVEIVGLNIGKMTAVKASNTGTITVEAKSSVVIQEVKLMQNEILQQFKNGSPIYVFKKLTVKLKP